MNELATVLLTNDRADLAAAIAASFPGMPVLECRSLPPRQRIDGRLWCFVDWLLEDTSGLEMCRRLRESPAASHGHITMVLDEDDSEIRRRAIRAGADDYLQGPLTPERLVERIRLYRSGTGLGGPSPRLAHGDLVVDLAARQVRWHGRIIALRPNEFSLLAHFVAHPDRVFSRSALIANLGKDGLAIDERTVDVWIGRLRRGLRAQGVPDPLRTVRSMGYVLDGLPAEAWREAG